MNFGASLAGAVHNQVLLDSRARNRLLAAERTLIWGQGERLPVQLQVWRETYLWILLPHLVVRVHPDHPGLKLDAWAVHPPEIIRAHRDHFERGWIVLGANLSGQAVQPDRLLTGRQPQDQIPVGPGLLDGPLWRTVADVFGCTGVEGLVWPAVPTLAEMAVVFTAPWVRGAVMCIRVT